MRVQRYGIMKLGGSSKMNNHNQVILPQDVKEVLGVEIGDNVGFWVDKETKTVQLFITK